MKVIIPLAGRGTRMRPHTHTKPKPLLPIAGKPAIDHVMDALSVLDVSEYIFITGHLKDQIEAHIKEKYDAPSRFIEQTAMDGTAGAVKLAEAYIDEPVLILFVDTLFETDLSIIEQSTDDGIIWAQEVEDYQRFGVIVHDENNIMTKIVEKPNEPISKLANIGMYYFKNYQLLFEGIEHIYKEGKTVKGEYFLPEAFMYMIGQGAKIKIEEVDGWYDCGKPETTLESNATLLKKHHAIHSKTNNSLINEPVNIGKNCIIENSTIGPNASIAPGCTIKNAVLKNIIIDENSTIENITLHDSILGQNTYIEGHNKEQEHTVLLGDHSEFRPKK